MCISTVIDWGESSSVCTNSPGIHPYWAMDSIVNHPWYCDLHSNILFHNSNQPEEPGIQNQGISREQHRSSYRARTDNQVQSASNLEHKNNRLVDKTRPHQRKQTDIESLSMLHCLCVEQGDQYEREIRHGDKVHCTTGQWAIEGDLWRYRYIQLLEAHLLTLNHPQFKWSNSRWEPCSEVLMDQGKVYRSGCCAV